MDVENEIIGKKKKMDDSEMLSQHESMANSLKEIQMTIFNLLK